MQRVCLTHRLSTLEMCIIVNTSKPPARVDYLTPSQRSEVMRSVKSKDTKAELIVRRLCRELDRAGYRLNRGDLPGSPDIAFISQKIAIFVHGCFWHGHTCKAGTNQPTSNIDYWRPKIARNQARDKSNLRALAAMGWKTLVIWECETKRDDGQSARRKLRSFFKRSHKADKS